MDQIAQRTPLGFPIVSKVDFDPGYLDEVLAPEAEYTWQFWLKHCCCCLWGKDLTPSFRRYKPDIRIGLNINNDLETMIAAIRHHLYDANAKSQGRLLAKKLIRTAYSLVAEADQSWHHNIEQCAQAVIKHKADHRKGITRALLLLSQKHV